MEDEIIKFFSVIEKQVQKLEYGVLTGTVLVAGGKPVTESLNLTLQRRKRYKQTGRELDKNDQG